MGIQRLSLKCVIEDKDNVDNFLEHFGASHPSGCNPFIMKRVKLEVPHEPELYNAISNFLEKYGRHIYHISI